MVEASVEWLRQGGPGSRGRWQPGEEGATRSPRRRTTGNRTRDPRREGLGERSPLPYRTPQTDGGVEQRAGIEDLDDGGVGMADGVSATGTEPVDDGRFLVGPGGLKGLSLRRGSPRSQAGHPVEGLVRRLAGITPSCRGRTWERSGSS